VNRRIPLALLALPIAGLLAGCSVSVSRTIPAENVAEAAAGALETEYDIVVESMDCGDDAVALVEGTEVACTVTVAGESADATVTIGDIDGDTYHVDVDVPQAPWLAGSDPGAGSGDSLTVYTYQLADAAADALEPTYGARPTIICPGDTIDISVGTTIECDLTEATSGARGVATITITELEGTEYKLTVEVVDA
jgi:hypothetical protein